MMDIEDGQLFIKSLAHFVRTHEKALANALQLKRQQNVKINQSSDISGNECATPISPKIPSFPSASSCSTSGTLAAAISLPYMTFTSDNIKAAKLALTPHHLFYLLSRFEELGIIVGPMNVRLENLQANTPSSNYVSFLNQFQRPKSGHCSDHGSIHSVSSVRSAFSGMTSLWANLSLGSAGNTTRMEKQKAATEADLKYLYASFTKIPCLRLSPDRRARLIQGYEEFPFDTAVPLHVFKNVSALEICDIDIRKFFGWDKLAEQLRSLVIKRAGVDEPKDLLINIVLDDMDRRRRRTTRLQSSPTMAFSPRSTPSLPHLELTESNSEPGSPNDRMHMDTYRRPRRESLAQSDSINSVQSIKGRTRRFSPVRPSSSRNGPQHFRDTYHVIRSGSGSSQSSISENWQTSRNYPYNMLSVTSLPPTKWRFLKHLSLADNGITSISADSLLPLGESLHSLDLSSNSLTEIPESLVSLTAIRALNLSNCMIDSLRSLPEKPLPSITALNLRSNRLTSLAGIECLQSLERLDIRDNNIKSPAELNRLTGASHFREIWVTGNPFTKTHASSYRVTIFNFFRRTPGFTDDISIDAHVPGYSERRQLSERAIKPTLPAKGIRLDNDVEPSQVSKSNTNYPINRQSLGLQGDKSSIIATTNEVAVSSNRRKNSSKGKTANLPKLVTSTGKSDTSFSTNNSHTPTFKSGNKSDDTTTNTLSSMSACQSSQSLQNWSQKDLQTISKPVVVSKLSVDTIPFDECLAYPESSDGSQIWIAGNEIYNKESDAIFDRVENRWLTVLSENDWDRTNSSHQAFSSVDHNHSFNTNRPISTTTRVNNNQTISNGGT